MTKIDLNRIATFVRVVEAGTFTHAAKQLGVPVSSVSRAVAALEDELGARLLHRTTRKLSLTDGGQHFFQRMQTVVTETAEAALAVAGFASDPRGLVRITAPHDLGGGRRFPDLVARLVRRHPGLVLELKLTNNFVDLVAEGMDLAIRAGALVDSSLVARKVSGSELGIFASPEYLRRRGAPRRPSDLVQHDCLTYGGREGKLPWRLSGPRGHQTIVVSGPVICNDMVFLREAVLTGIGLGLVPVEIVMNEVKAGRLVRVLPKYGYPGGGIYVVWPSQKLVPARVVAVREMLIEELTRMYAQPA
jgi:DNA-binding transcriptional LysR family regulator